MNVLISYLADELRDMFDVGDLSGLAVVQAGSPGLVALHAVLHLEDDNTS